MTQTSRLHLPHFLAALAVLYVTGVGLALSGDLASLGTAIANGSKLNAPLPIIAAQLLGGFAAGRRGGRRGPGAQWPVGRRSCVPVRDRRDHRRHVAAGRRPPAAGELTSRPATSDAG